MNVDLDFLQSEIRFAVWHSKSGGVHANLSLKEDAIGARFVVDVNAVDFAFAAWLGIFWPLLASSGGYFAVDFRAVVAPFVASWLVADVVAAASVRPLSVLFLDGRA